MSTQAENLCAADRLVSASDLGTRDTTDHSEAVGLKVLMLVPQRLADDRNEAVRKGVRPQADYDALAAALSGAPGGKADILDLSSLERNRHWLIRLVQRLAGPYWALALLGHLRYQGYDAVFSHSEIVGLPFALMAALPGPRHVMTAYYLTGRRNAFWHRVLRVHRRIDTIFTQAREQYETGRKALRLPDDKLVHVEACGYVDSNFFAATPVAAVPEQQLCSAGREYRDYETLIKAMADLPKLTLKVDPASPWSLQSDELAGVKLPPNVEVCRMELGAVCRLYAESAAVVIPLHPNAIGAGTTTLVEAMSMGKPVIITRSKDGSFAGRADLEDGHNVILVEPHDIAGLRSAIERLMGDRDLRTRIGANARQWAERHAGREQWLGIMLRALRGSPATERSRHDR
jgi:glycosyltransferase involved in cell wall biosynthesis